MTLNTRPPTAVLFDLDGTLIDSAPDIAAAVNELLGSRNLPPLTVPQVTLMIGNGVEKLVERAFAAIGQLLTPGELEQALREMKPIYLRHVVDRTTLMPGALEALSSLRGRGIALGVVTNKPSAATHEILSHFGFAEMLGVVVGGDDVANKKPAPDALFLASERLGAKPADTVMVGDSRADVDAARAAGLRSVLVRGGYSQTPVEELGADLVIDGLGDLVEAIS